ncbi:MAG: hypothetical protein HY235_18595 [Acidobacteria bacterium]|nr:hypothetical protein [Acidobacteriota bacterium]
MPALPFPTYGLSHLYLFPVYQTREAYRQATGQEAPPYDSSKPVKSWFDPKAAESPRRKIIYENVVAYADDGAPLASPDGKPVLEPLLIDREIATRVNIPPKVPGLPDLPVTGIEVPVPLRALEPGEELYFQFGGSVAVKNKELFANLETGFTAHDRALLRAIGEKIGLGR